MKETSQICSSVCLIPTVWPAKTVLRLILRRLKQISASVPEFVFEIDWRKTPLLPVVCHEPIFQTCGRLPKPDEYPDRPRQNFEHLFVQEVAEHELQR
jgi:hypothetical protein